MAGSTLDFDTVLSKDDLAGKLCTTYMSWEMARNTKLAQWKELRNYLFATDTTTTSNSKLPWKNLHKSEITCTPTTWRLCFQSGSG
jgi:hypothetical protein